LVDFGNYLVHLPNALDWFESLDTLEAPHRYPTWSPDVHFHGFWLLITLFSIEASLTQSIIEIFLA